MVDLKKLLDDQAQVKSNADYDDVDIEHTLDAIEDTERTHFYDLELWSEEAPREYTNPPPVNPALPDFTDEAPSGRTLTTADLDQALTDIEDVQTSVSGLESSVQTLEDELAEVAANIRTLLTADTTYYVATTGNDTTGDGSVGNPWLTPNKAVDHVINKIDCQGFNVTIQLADGTYSNSPIYIASGLFGISKSSTAADQVFLIKGNTITPANVVISVETWGDADVQLQGVTLCGAAATITGAWTGIGAYDAARVSILSNCRFIASDYSHIYLEGTTNIQVKAGYEIAGSASYHIDCEETGQYQHDPWDSTHVITVTGTPSFTVFVFCGRFGTCNFAGATFSGSATGKRYESREHATIMSTNTLPGSVAGDVQEYALYNWTGAGFPGAPASVITDPIGTLTSGYPTSPSVARLGSAYSDGTSPFSYTVSAGTNRCLIVAVMTESSANTAMSVDYGGRAMTQVHRHDQLLTTTYTSVAIFYLNEAGIAAASNTTLTVTAPTGYAVYAQAYQHAQQTTPSVYDSESAASDADPLLNISISATKGSAVFGASAVGITGTTPSWAGTNGLTALTSIVINMSGASGFGAIADRLCSVAESVQHHCTWTSTVNRIVGVAILIEQAVNPSYDFAIADMTQSTPWGFVSFDEAQTLLRAVINMQTRINELESRLQTLGLLS